MPEQSNAMVALKDRRALVAVIIVAASFLPLIGSGPTSTSLINVQSQVGAASQALDTMGSMMGAATGISVGQMTGGLNLLLALYIVPLTAVLVVVMALMARGTRVWGILNGAAAIVLPVALPLVAGSLFMSALPDQLRSIVAQGGGVNVTSFGIGVWALVLLGAVQLFFSFTAA